MGKMNWLEIHKSNVGVLLRYESPGDRNALCLEVVQALVAKAEEAAEGGAGVYTLVMGRPHRLPFCAGGNVQTYARMKRDEALAEHEKIRNAIEKFRTLPVLFELYVGGDVWGGGWELMSACDRVAAYPEARIFYNQILWGVGPGWWGGARLIEKRGPSVAGAITSGVEESLRAYAARVPGTALLPRQFFDDDVCLSRHWQRAWAHVKGLDPSAWRDLVRALRSADRGLEEKSFSELWGNGRHREMLTEWQK